MDVDASRVSSSDIIIVTTPTVPGYHVKNVVSVVTGLTARTRGMGGKFVAGVQSMFGGEVSAFTSEIEKARGEAMERMKEKARKLGANAIIGLDIETSDVLQGTVLISATGTAVVIELDQSKIFLKARNDSSETEQDIHKVRPIYLRGT